MTEVDTQTVAKVIVTETTDEREALNEYSIQTMLFAGFVYTPDTKRLSEILPTCFSVLFSPYLPKEMINSVYDRIKCRLVHNFSSNTDYFVPKRNHLYREALNEWLHENESITPDRVARVSSHLSPNNREIFTGETRGYLDQLIDL